jgi:hypothetical protein
MNEQTAFGRLGRDYMDASAPKKRILILGAGFGGVYTALHLERLSNAGRMSEGASALGFEFSGS